MRSNLRFPVLALIVALIVGLASPAGAAASHRGRSDPSTASDGELDQAVQTMNKQVANEQARAESAQQALDAATAQEQAADAQVAASEAKVDQMRVTVEGRAIETYIHPQTASMYPIFDGKDLSEMSRRAALYDEVARHDRDLLDQLIATRTDLVNDQQLAARARTLADQRRQLEAQTLKELQQAQSDRQRLQGVLQARIADYQQEADEVAADEANLSNLIRSRAAPAPASRGAGDNANGRTSSSGLIWPVTGPLTSPFGYRWGRLHAGIDIGVGIGTPIHAAKAGTVIFSGQMSGYGNVIVIDHGGGFSTLYAHQSRLAARDGQQVNQGDVIGYSGNTGDSTGPHVHFETRVNGNPQNPRQYLP